MKQSNKMPIIRFALWAFACALALLAAGHVYLWILAHRPGLDIRQLHQADWLRIGVWALVGTCTLLALWALFWGRAKGRVRCPKCCYDMSATAPASLICPECGHDAKHYKHLTKTRRKWKLAISCALLAVMLPNWLLPAEDRRWEEGWLALIPTTPVMIMLRFVKEDYDNPVHEFATQRSREASAWHLPIIGIDPPELSQAHAQRVVYTPEVWPQGLPIYLTVDLYEYRWFAGPNDGLGGWYQFATVENEAGEELARNESIQDWFFVDIFPMGDASISWLLPCNEPSCSYRLKVKLHRAWGYDGDVAKASKEFWITKTVRTVPEGAYHKVKQPNQSTRVATGIVNNTTLRMYDTQEDGPYLYAHLQIHSHNRDIDTAHDIEIVRNDTVIWKTTSEKPSVLHAGAYFDDHGELVAQSASSINALSPHGQGNQLDLSGCTVRFVSRPDLAIHNHYKAQYWDGSIEVPLAAIFKNEDPNYTVVGDHDNDGRVDAYQNNAHTSP